MSIQLTNSADDELNYQKKLCKEASVCKIDRLFSAGRLD